MRSCVVLGSGRSGTSMVAGLLAGAGYHMGDQLLPATASNPRGYFEDRAVNALNEDLLGQVLPRRPEGALGRLYPHRLHYGHRWLARIDVGVTLSSTFEIEGTMRTLTTRRPFCLKDPRFCYTLDCWRQVLDDAVYICVFREPTRTAASMIADSRERTYLQGMRLTRRRALEVWTSMYEHVLERHHREGRWLFVHYEQVLAGSAIARIEDLVEADVDSGFVDPALKRSRASGRLPDRTASVYRRLCELAGYEGCSASAAVVSPAADRQ